jgi:hypothetical protein
VLFDFGADILAGVRVTDWKEVVKGVTQGMRMAKMLHGVEPVCLFKVPS